MKGGSRRRATTGGAERGAQQQATQEARHARHASPVPGHDDGPQHRDGSIAQIDAAGEDHHRLSERQDPDHHRLLEQQRQVVGREEGVGGQGKSHHRRDQGEQGARARRHPDTRERATQAMLRAIHPQQLVRPKVVS
jgi:hypothetical protein